MALNVDSFINNFSDTPLNINFIRSNCVNCQRLCFVHKESDYTSCGCISSYPFDQQELNSMTASNIARELSRFALESSGLEEKRPLNVLNKRRTPLFISAGVQIIDNVIHDEETASMETLVVAQPSTRLNFLGKTAVDKSFYTSFMNMALIKADCDFESHVMNTNLLIEFFESLGIDKTELVLTLRESQNDWGDGLFNSIVIDILYRGVVIGDSVLIQDYPQKTRPVISVSDISFGLERLIYATTGSVPENKLFNNIENEEYVNLDLLKTLTLLVGSMVFPSSTHNPGRKTRELIKILNKYGKLDSTQILDQVVNTYWNWWSQFTDLSMRPEDIIEIITEEKNNLMISTSSNNGKNNIRRDKVAAIKEKLIK